MAYLVMEYLPGITLRDLLKDYGKLTPEQTIDIMEAVLSGLAAAHKAGIVHRDLKPENVLLADDGRIKIGDFGLARAASANTATGQALLGTIAYLSPELVTRGVADARSDIYALGIMMYEMLTGEQPFKGEQPMQIAYQHANDAVPAPSSKNPAVPPELDDLVLWATAKDPDQRPRDAREMLDRLLEAEKAIRGEAVAAADDGAAAGARTRRRRRRHPDHQPGHPAAGRRQHARQLRPTLTQAAAKRRVRRAGGCSRSSSCSPGLAGGTGWYFGAGPGSTGRRSPNVVEQGPGRGGRAAAGARLRVGPGAPSTARRSRRDWCRAPIPKPERSADRGSTVTLSVSQGPKPITIPPLAGQTVDRRQDGDHRRGRGGRRRRAAVRRRRCPRTRSSPRPDAPTAATSRAAAPTSRARRSTCVVSVGRRSRMSPASRSTTRRPPSARSDCSTSAGPAELQRHRRRRATSSRRSRRTTARCARATPSLLETSKGPEPVPVPDVVGKTWDVAKKALTDAGFKLKYSAIADVAPAGVRRLEDQPRRRHRVPKGSTVTVNFAGF